MEPNELNLKNCSLGVRLRLFRSGKCVTSAERIFLSSQMRPSFPPVRSLRKSRPLLISRIALSVSYVLAFGLFGRIKSIFRFILLASRLSIVPYIHTTHIYICK